MAKGSCVQQRHTLDCINGLMEPTPVEKLNKKGVKAIHCAFLGALTQTVLLISGDEVTD